MINKTNGFSNILLISLMGAVLFGSFSGGANAQYSNYNYPPYTQLYVTTEGANFITSNSATLNGVVNGNNSNLGTWFEYGTTPSFGLSSLRNNYNYTGSNFSATIGSLSAGTTYYFRAVAQNTWGTVYGNTNTFRTNFASYTNTGGEVYNIYNTSTTPLQLTAITRPANSIGARSVDLNAHIINTPGNTGSTWFEWGTDYALVNQTPILTLGTLPAVNHLSTITKLAPSTTYYFRAVVINNFTRSNGATLSFTTKAAAATPAPSEPKSTPKDVIEETRNLSPLSAGVIGAGSFLPKNAFEWTILAILVAVLIILGKNIYAKK